MFKLKFQIKAVTDFGLFHEKTSGFAKLKLLTRLLKINFWLVELKTVTSKCNEKAVKGYTSK